MEQYLHRLRKGLKAHSAYTVETMNSLRVWVGNFLLILLVSSLVGACGREEEKKPANRDNYLSQGSARMQKFIEKAKRERDAKGSSLESFTKDKYRATTHGSPSFLAPLI